MSKLPIAGKHDDLSQLRPKMCLNLIYIVFNPSNVNNCPDVYYTLGINSSEQEHTREQVNVQARHKCSQAIISKQITISVLSDTTFIVVHKTSCDSLCTIHVRSNDQVDTTSGIVKIPTYGNLWLNHVCAICWQKLAPSALRK